MDDPVVVPLRRRGSCPLCLDLGGIAVHILWSEQRGKPLWTAHEYPSDDPHPTLPCPMCAGKRAAAELLELCEAGELMRLADAEPPGLAPVMCVGVVDVERIARQIDPGEGDR